MSTQVSFDQHYHQTDDGCRICYRIEREGRHTGTLPFIGDSVRLWQGPDHPGFDQALRALLTAEQLAPEEVRYQPAARALVTNLLHRERAGRKHG